MTKRDNALEMPLLDIETSINRSFERPTRNEVKENPGLSIHLEFLAPEEPCFSIEKLTIWLCSFTHSSKIERHKRVYCVHSGLVNYVLKWLPPARALKSSDSPYLAVSLSVPCCCNESCWKSYAQRTRSWLSNSLRHMLCANQLVILMPPSAPFLLCFATVA